MEAKVYVSCNQPWIKCLCPSCGKEFDDFTINYCQKCGVNVTFNNFHLIYNHYDRCNLYVEWQEPLIEE